MEEQKLHHYLKKIRQIDDILFPAVKCLIKIAKEAESDDPLRKKVEKPICFPPWVSEHTTAPAGSYLLTRAACSGTLLRIWRIRRRFPRLFEELKDKELLKELGDLEEALPKTFTPKPNNSANFDNCIPLLDSNTFGPLNPLTASCVFSVLMDGGENLTHSGIGFLACFAMLWSLYRKFPNSHAEGAQLDPWGPSAYVTAKCLLPLRSLEKLSRRRARSIEELKKLISVLDKYSKENDPYARWKFTLTLETLSSLLRGASKIAIDRKTMEDCSDTIGDFASDRNGSNNRGTCGEVVQALNDTLTKLSQKRQECANKAQSMLNQIKSRILSGLESASKGKSGEIHLTRDISLRLPPEWTEQPKYWEDLKSSADSAYKACYRAYEIIVEASDKPPRDGKSIEELKGRLDRLRKAHEGLANLFDEQLRPYARECLRIVQREIANISAQNETDFAPSELVNAILVAVHWGEMRSELEVKDAVEKAVSAGMRKDGSWVPGQPFYTSGRALTLVPTTSDVVWPLATAVMANPKIDIADDAFERYVDWLERTRLKQKVQLSNKTDRIDVTGWASDRARGPRRIDLWATALAINALLEIRDIFEYRLWQLCEECYTVLPVDDQGLNKIDPVDLKLRHKKRLHRKLSQIFRDAQDEERCKEARYAFVLYGPPGSSKTTIASALAAEIWRPPGAEERDRPRFVRITPADFTRQGEARLDWEARLIFELLQGLRKVTVFFDEIDDLLHKRNPKKDPTFMKLITPAMLNRLQDLRDVCPRQEVCIIFATNYLKRIEPALLRKGRVDECIFVDHPDPESRRSIVWRNIDKHNGKSGKADLLKRYANDVVDGTHRWPWKYIDELCRRILQSESKGTKEKKYIKGLITEGAPPKSAMECKD